MTTLAKNAPRPPPHPPTSRRRSRCWPHTVTHLNTHDYSHNIPKHAYMTCIQLPRRAYCAGHFALKMARCITLPARAGALPWYAHLTVDIFEGDGKGSARKVVSYARACVWGGSHVCECCLMMTCSVCLNETTTAHPMIECPCGHRHAKSTWPVAAI